MTAFMNRFIFSSLTGLIMFGILAEAKAQSRMGMMMMGRQQMMMNSGMMNMGMMNSGFPFFPGFGNGLFGWRGYGLGGYGLGGYGLGGYGYGGLYPDGYSGTDDSQNAYPTSRRRRAYQEEPPTPTPEEEREQIHKLELAWSQGDLSELETRSATALNILLADLQQLQAKGINGPEVKLDEEILQHINVVMGRSSGNVAVLRDEGQIRWPETLRGPEFAVERNLISSLAPKAIAAAKNAERIDLNEMTGALTAMNRRLAAHINDLPTPAYIRAKRFLVRLDDALRLLRQPDAGNYFNQTYAAKGKTVMELVRNMTEQSLRFAPAAEGDEPAYQVLHQALAQSDVAAHAQLVARK